MHVFQPSHFIDFYLYYVSNFGLHTCHNIQNVDNYVVSKVTTLEWFEVHDLSPKLQGDKKIMAPLHNKITYFVFSRRFFAILHNFSLFCIKNQPF